jgi:hypothetical protein
MHRLFLVIHSFSHGDGKAIGISYAIILTELDPLPPPPRTGIRDHGLALDDEALAAPPTAYRFKPSTNLTSRQQSAREREEKEKSNEIQ